MPTADSPGRIARVEFTGTRSELFGILLRGYLLMIPTAGISVAGGIGASLIDSRFSREAEREADRFAADAAKRMGFAAAGMVNLIERVAADDEMSKALALLSTHPLTSERRAALEAMATENAAGTPAFTAEEWAAIKSMCGTTPAATPASEVVPADPAKTGRNG